MTMNHDEEDDIVNPESLPIYRKGKEIFDMVNKITALIPEDNEYLMDVKGCMFSDAAMLTVKVAGAEAAGLYDLKMENDGSVPFRYRGTSSLRSWHALRHLIK